MKAIIYTTQTGSIERYAKLLAHETGLPAYTLAEAKKAVLPGGSVIYLGWIMAGCIKGYAAALALWNQLSAFYNACEIVCVDNTIRVQCFFEETAPLSALLPSAHNTLVILGRVCAAVALGMMLVGAVGMKIVPAAYFGVVERFSVFAATGFNAALGIHLFCSKP